MVSSIETAKHRILIVGWDLVIRIPLLKGNA
jgi:hypothetical protein